MKIEIWSDVICPFCYIGYQRLTKALEATGITNAEIIWKSYQLDPEFPENSKGISTYEYLETRKGMTQDQVLAASLQLQQQAAQDGAILNFDKAIVINTGKAHRLLHFAQEHGKETQVKVALFKAHFTNGLNIADNATLIAIAAEAGLDTAKVETVLTTDAYAYDVVQDIQEGVNLGLRGVPFFVVNRKYGIPGAHPLEVFVNTLQKAKADEIPLQMEGENGSYCDPKTGKCE